MSGAELTSWQAFWRIAPWGERRADIRAAQICTLLANAHFKKTGGEGFSIDDFLLFDGEKPDGQPVDRQLAIAKAMNWMYGKPKNGNGKA